ncbi:MAG: peptidoglycan DD-metalloendopeptidase family protein [Dongiaceae bacterium]
MRRQLGMLQRRFADEIDRLFVPRELLVRSEGRVRYLRVSRRQQMAAAVAVAALTGWTLVSTAGLVAGAFLYEEQNTRRDSTIADSDSPEQASSEAAVLAALAASKLAVERELATARDAFVAVDDHRQRAAAARDRYAVAWRNAERELEAERAHGSALSTEVGGLHSEIESLKRAAADGEAAQRRLERRVAALSVGLAAAATENRRLTQSVIGMRRTVASIADDRRALRDSRSELSSQVALLEGRVSSLRSTQENIVQRLADRTRMTVAEIEKAVLKTGLDVDGLLDAVVGKMTGAGGPFVPVAHPLRSAEERTLLASIRKLDGEVDRWGRLQLVLRSLPLATPLDAYTVMSGFGERKDPINGKRALHAGIDLKNRVGTPVLATAPGTVVYAGWMRDYGRIVEIDHGLGIRTRYAHLKSISVKVGQAVEFRQQIGKLGSSGRSTGPHLHYEVQVNGKPYDPMNFMEAGKYVFKG